MSDPLARCDQLRTEAEIRLRDGFIDESIELVLQALAVAHNDSNLLADLYFLCAIAYAEKAKNERERAARVDARHKAIGMLRKLRDLYALQGNQHAEASVYFEIAGMAQAIDVGSDEAVVNYEHTIRLAAVIQDKKLECDALSCLGNLLKKKGKASKDQYDVLMNPTDGAIGPQATSLFEAAIQKLEMALVIARESEFGQDLDGIGSLIGDLAECQFLLSNFEGSKKLYEERLAIADSLRDKPAQRRTNGSLGNIYLATGQPKEAIKCYRQALSIATELDDHRAMALHYMSMSDAFIEDNEYDDARFYLNKCKDQFKMEGDVAGQQKAYRKLAELQTTACSYPSAAYFYAVNRRLAKKVGDDTARSEAHEKLYEMKQTGQVAISDGKLVLDSSFDKDPIEVILSESLRSVYLHGSEPSLYSACGASDTTRLDTPSALSNDQSVSNANKPRLIQRGNDDDFFAMLEKMGNRLDDQRAEMPLPVTGRASTISAVSISSDRSPSTSKSRFSLLKRVKSSMITPKFTSTPLKKKSKIPFMRSTKSLKSLTKFGGKSSKSAAHLEFPKLDLSMASSNDGDCLFRVPELPIRAESSRMDSRSMSEVSVGKMDDNVAVPEDMTVSFNGIDGSNLWPAIDEDVAEAEEEKPQQNKKTPLPPPRKSRLPPPPALLAEAIENKENNTTTGPSESKSVLGRLSFASLPFMKKKPKLSSRPSQSSLAGPSTNQ